jgi:hypothetical protein
MIEVRNQCGETNSLKTGADLLALTFIVAKRAWG